jgi:NADH-quinone oxidoreductase subunit J
MNDYTLFFLLAGLTLAAALGAVALRSLIHCALCLALALLGVAAQFIRLGADFVGWAQILVYVGAVAILIIFAVLLTCGGETSCGEPRVNRAWPLGLLVALGTLACLVATIARSPSLHQAASHATSPSVKDIGAELMTRYVLPLEVVGLLLTAALIGAAILALHERGRP